MKLSSGYLVIGTVLAASNLPVGAVQYTIQGTLCTAATDASRIIGGALGGCNQPIEGARVSALDRNGWHIGSTYTVVNGNGAFQIIITVDPNTPVHLAISLENFLPTGTHTYKVVADDGSTTIYDDWLWLGSGNEVAATTDTVFNLGVVNVHSGTVGGTNLIGTEGNLMTYSARAYWRMWDLSLGHCAPKGDVTIRARHQVNDAYDAYASGYDVNVGRALYSSESTLPPINTTAARTSYLLSTVSHECGHTIHYAAGMPSAGGIYGQYASTHWYTLDSNMHTAWIDGWAEFVQFRTVPAALTYTEMSYKSPGDAGMVGPAGLWWKADASSIPGGTKRTGADNSGFTVEGAVAASLLDWVMDSTCDLWGIWTVMETHVPRSFPDLLRLYGEMKCPPPPTGYPANVERGYKTAARNGCVDARARLVGQHVAGSPTRVPVEGNVRDLTKGAAKVRFVRGNVHYAYDKLQNAYLFLPQDLPVYPALGQIRLGLMDSSAAPLTWNASGDPSNIVWSNPSNWGDSVKVSFSGDGQVQVRLVAQVKNGYGYWDSLYPDFSGDPHPSFPNTDAWLMTRGPETMRNLGIIVKDNTAPLVSNIKPAPN